MSKTKDKIEEEKEFARTEPIANEPKGYEFNKEKHLHTFNGKSLTGCTTILAVLAKPALIQWSANMAVEYISDYVTKTPNWHWKDTDWTKLFTEAKTAHRRKKEEAGQKGTDVHETIENIIARLIATNKGIFKGDEKSEIPQVQHFIDWAIKSKVKFLESEKNIYSQSLWVGGIVDIVCEIDGEIWIADIKTGSGIYPEHFAQMAGYELMLKEMGFEKPVKGHIVLNLKKDGTFQERKSVSTEDAKNFFLACVSVYRLQEKFNNQII